ncbi:hypothetical protein T4A_2977 [Trichinella pseudospiralis]|uniref:Uncharacterized protein n=1 Tax=Trichinella pseudospiralis TaxID=6337 RepID=A0A0V1E5N8_TRIPS|nr:hypothetical protein T4A_2977 [Trichinella pseudospiralis]
MNFVIKLISGSIVSSLLSVVSLTCKFLSVALSWHWRRLHSYISLLVDVVIRVLDRLAHIVDMKNANNGNILQNAIENPPPLFNVSSTLDTEQQKSYVNNNRSNTAMLPFSNTLSYKRDV